MTNAAWPKPCGDTTTRKNETRQVVSPSTVAFKVMPGFSPDQSTGFGFTGGRAIACASHAPSRPVWGPCADYGRPQTTGPLWQDSSRGPGRISYHRQDPGAS